MSAKEYQYAARGGNAWTVPPAHHVCISLQARENRVDSRDSSIRHFHALCRDRTCSVSVLAPAHILARPLRPVQAQAPPPPADKL